MFYKVYIYLYSPTIMELNFKSIKDIWKIPKYLEQSNAALNNHGSNKNN